MINDDWASDQFAREPTHSQPSIERASVTAVNHHGTIFKSLKVDANFKANLCASACFMHSSPDPSTTWDSIQLIFNRMFNRVFNRVHYTLYG